VIDRQHNLGDHRSRHRFYKPRAGTNNPRVLGLWSNHETRDILDKEQRRLVTVAGIDKVRDFLGRLCVNDAAETRRAASRNANHAAVVRDHANLNSANARVACDHLPGVISLKLIEMTPIQKTAQQLSHIVWLPVILRNDVVKRFDCERGFHGLGK
jgi:hypothetical protein